MLVNLQPLTVHVYRIITGEHITRLPYSVANWSDSINEPGQSEVELVYSSFAKKIAVDGRPLFDVLKRWKVILAIQRGRRVIHAGPLTARKWDATNRKLSLSCGGGWTLMGKRLVLNHGLATSFRSGDVLIDEDHPAGDWALTLKGSYRDIARGLVDEALKWGPLPITLPPLQGGSFTRTYGGYDLATVADRLSDLSKLEHAQEYRFTPTIDNSGRLMFALEAATELVDHNLKLNAAVPGQRVKLTAINDSEDTVSNQVWAVGGKNDDKTVMANATLPASLRDAEVPLLQSSNTEHTTVIDWKRLREYARSQVSLSAYPGESYQLDIGEEHDPHVGDHLDVRVEDDFLGRRLLRLKIVDVSGSSDSDWRTVQARGR